MDRYFEEFLQPRSNSKIHDLLQLGLLPPIPGLYREDAMRPRGLSSDHLTVPLRDCSLESFEQFRQRTGQPPVDGLLITHGYKGCAPRVTLRDRATHVQLCL